MSEREPLPWDHPLVPALLALDTAYAGAMALYTARMAEEAALQAGSDVLVTAPRQHDPGLFSQREKPRRGKGCAPG